MMVQARGYMDVASEPLGNFYWNMRPVLNACNFAGAFGWMQGGRGRAVLLALVWNGIPRRLSSEA